MHSFCKLKVAHLTVTKNLMMKTLPDMGSPIYSQLQGKQKISFYISFLFFAMFTDGLVFDVILILAVTHQTLFVGFFFLVAYWWFLVERNVGVRRIDRSNTLKKPQSPPPQKTFSLTWPAAMQIYWKKKAFLHKEKVQLLQDWFGAPADIVCYTAVLSVVTQCSSPHAQR